jgi:hypothetical protein
MEKNRIGAKIFLSAVLVLSAVEEGNSMKVSSRPCSERRGRWIYIEPITPYEKFKTAVSSRNKDRINSAILERRTNVNMTNGYGRTVLHNIVGYPEYIKIVGFLLKKYGANVNTVDKDGRTPLHDAAESGGLPMVKLLVEYKANPNVEDDWGFTPLDDSANGEIYDFLVQAAEMAEFWQESTEEEESDEF